MGRSLSHGGRTGKAQAPDRPDGCRWRVLRGSGALAQRMVGDGHDQERAVDRRPRPKPTQGPAVAIQTKTASHGSEFQLSAKSEEPSSAENQWYVFVKLHEERTRPSFYVVPRNIVAGFVYATHREWLSRPGRGGRAHNDTTKRAAATKYLVGYEDRWDLLDGPADQAPLLAGQWYTECVERFGLPAGHPGWPPA
jgi:hypothetical protein